MSFPIGEDFLRSDRRPDVQRTLLASEQGMLQNWRGRGQRGSALLRLVPTVSSSSQPRQICFRRIDLAYWLCSTARRS